MLSDPQIERYSRQILISEIGGRGQERLLASRVAIVGDDPVVPLVGAYLAAAGIGSLSVPHPLVSELSSLNPDCRVAEIATGDARLSHPLVFGDSRAAGVGFRHPGESRGLELGGAQNAGIPALDSGFRRNDERTENVTSKKADILVDVVISTQGQAAEVSSLAAACTHADTTFLWGTSCGCWAVLHPSPEPLPCVECLLACSEGANPASSFWVASQLSMAAMRAILGLGLPSKLLPYCFSELGSRGNTVELTFCEHRFSSQAEAARVEM